LGRAVARTIKRGRLVDRTSQGSEAEKGEWNHPEGECRRGVHEAKGNVGRTLYRRTVTTRSPYEKRQKIDPV